MRKELAPSSEASLGHAAKTSVGLSSDPRSSSAPRSFRRFMIRGPFSTVLAPLTDGERCVGLSVFSPGSVSVSNTSFDHLRHRSVCRLSRGNRVVHDD